MGSEVDVIHCYDGPSVAFMEWKCGVALSHLVHGMKKRKSQKTNFRDKSLIYYFHLQVCCRFKMLWYLKTYKVWIKKPKRKEFLDLRPTICKFWLPTHYMTTKSTKLVNRAAIAILLSTPSCRSKKGMTLIISRCIKIIIKYIRPQ